MEEQNNHKNLDNNEVGSNSGLQANVDSKQLSGEQNPAFASQPDVRPLAFDSDVRGNNILGIVLTSIIALTLLGGGGVYVYRTIQENSQKKEAKQASENTSIQETNNAEPTADSETEETPVSESTTLPTTTVPSTSSSTKSTTLKKSTSSGVSSTASESDSSTVTSDPVPPAVSAESTETATSDETEEVIPPPPVPE